MPLSIWCFRFYLKQLDALFKKKNIVDDLLRRTGLFRDLQSECLQELHREVEMENRNIVEDLIVSILVDFVFQSLGEDVDHVFSSLRSVDRLMVHFVFTKKIKQKKLYSMNLRALSCKKLLTPLSFK